ncbi:heavy metal-associated isoprenylated plant protein 3-like [Cornus florida]|uniref:heavy metal-associated isoprenylated plant protein 3-like n=1 Tax=Cornus florida TaxID=4283 RepID=UPI00289ACA33|nr:heavy metal-associated isoprenylated plant protein 3-like [Cornus florida]
MGDKKNKKEGEKKQNEGGKKDDGSTSVVLRIEMHCEGCATKIKKSILSFDGVETIKRDEKDSNKITVTGKVDPAMFREKLEQKLKRKVELLSPLPKKDDNKDKDKKKTDDKPEKKADDKKPKETPVTTAVLKLNLHCEGCIQKIHRIVTKTKGYQEMSIDREKDTVTVKGAMDAKALAESLKDRLRRSVEIVPPAKKEKEGGGGGGEKKEKGGGEKKEKGGGQDKAAAVGGGGGESAGGYMAEENRMEYGYPYPYVYGSGHVAHDHAPQMFSDENPNACSVM